MAAYHFQPGYPSPESDQSTCAAESEEPSIGLRCASLLVALASLAAFPVVVAAYWNWFVVPLSASVPLLRATHAFGLIALRAVLVIGFAKTPLVNWSKKETAVEMRAYIEDRVGRLALLALLWVVGAVIA